LEIDDDYDRFIQGFVTRNELIVVTTAIASMQMKLFESISYYYANKREDAHAILPEVLEKVHEINGIIQKLAGNSSA
jgi:hypothetical protein